MVLNVKKLIKALYPPLWVTILLTIVCTASLIYTFIGGYEAHPLAYLTYVLSFYTLVVIVMWGINAIPKHYKAAKQKAYENPLSNRFLTDYHFRTHISLYRSLIVNLLYVATNVISGF